MKRYVVEKIEENVPTHAPRKRIQKASVTNPLFFVKWVDTREVSVCSIIHQTFFRSTVQRTVQTQVTGPANPFHAQQLSWNITSIWEVLICQTI